MVSDISGTRQWRPCAGRRFQKQATGRFQDKALRANLIGQHLGSCWSQQLVCCLRHGGAAGLDGQTGLLRPQISWLYVSRNDEAETSLQAGPFSSSRLKRF